MPSINSDETYFKRVAFLVHKHREALEWVYKMKRNAHIYVDARIKEENDKFSGSRD